MLLENRVSGGLPLQFQTDLFLQMISPRKVGEEGGMWTLERKSLFANKIHASSHEERRLHELFFERCCHLLL